jgi:hypothetical protein
VQALVQLRQELVKIPVFVANFQEVGEALNDEWPQDPLFQYRFFRRRQR